MKLMSFCSTIICREGSGCQQSRCAKKQAPYHVCKRSSNPSPGQWWCTYSSPSTTSRKRWCPTEWYALIPTTTTATSFPTSAYANGWTTTFLAWSTNAARPNGPTLNATTATSVQTSTSTHDASTSPSSGSWSSKATPSNVDGRSTCLETTTATSANGWQATYATTVWDATPTTTPFWLKPRV